jgi:hypothetical protein
MEFAANVFGLMTPMRKLVRNGVIMIFADWAVYSLRCQFRRRIAVYTARPREHIASGHWILFVSTLLCLPDEE